MWRVFIPFTLLAIFPWLQTVVEVDSLNHGRPAKLGDFPFVMRIRINEETTTNLTDDAESGNVATGVLVYPTKVLTTCDSVGFFTGQTVNKYNLSRVTIMGGSVNKSGVGGQIKTPIKSTVHRFCYSLMVSKIVLFNFGMYELDSAYDSPHISPAKNPFKHSSELTQVMRSGWNQWKKLPCVVAGWGNPRKQFEGSGMPDHFERFAQILQKTDMRLTTFEYCRTEKCHYLGDCLSAVWEYGFVCAQAKYGGPCNEDEGAPLVCGGVVMAIYADVERCEDIGMPRSFSRIDLAYEFVYGKQRATTIRAAHLLMYTVSALPYIPHFN